MVKKITAYILLAVAYLVVAAHAVIPHHHHGKQLCLEREHCKSHAVHHQHNQQEQDHQHDNNNDPNTCCLGEYLPSSTNRIYRIGNRTDVVDLHFHDLQFFIVSSDSQTSSILARGIHFISDFSPHYSFLYQTSPCLRAPPALGKC